MSSPMNTPWPSAPQANGTIGDMSSSRLAGGSSSVASGKEKDQDVNSSASTRPTNALSPGSQIPTTLQPRATSPISGAIRDQPLARAESLFALQKIQEAGGHTDSASDNETEQGPRKRARREQPVEKQQQFKIGHHINAPGLPIYASLDAKENLVVQMIKSETPQDVLDDWSSLGPGASISLQTTVLDMDLFPPLLHSLNVEILGKGQKKNLVREFLEAKRDNQEMNVEAWFLKSLEIHVGVHQQDGKTPVHCYLKLHKSGKLHPTFRVRSSDALKSDIELGNRLVAYKAINYIKQYARSSPEDSKQAIQEKLEKLAQPILQASPVQPEQALQLLKTMLEQESGATGATGPENEDYGLVAEFRNNLMRTLQGKGTAVGHHAKKLANSVSEFVGVAASQEKLASDTLIEVEKLRKENIEQAKKIAELQATVSQMQSQMADQHTHGSASRFQSIDIEHCLLETVPSNVGSPGLLRTPEGEGRKLELEGKKFEERIWLLECRLQCKGQPTGKTIQHEGLSFRHIVDGTDEKFVQNLELSSLVQSEGRQFLKWVTLTVPPPPQTNTYHGI